MKTEYIEELLDSINAYDNDQNNIELVKAVKAVGYALCEQLRRDDEKRKQMALDAIDKTLDLFGEWLFLAKKLELPKDVLDQMTPNYEALKALRKTVEEV